MNGFEKLHCICKMRAYQSQNVSDNNKQAPQWLFQYQLLHQILHQYRYLASATRRPLELAMRLINWFLYQHSKVNSEYVFFCPRDSVSHYIIRPVPYSIFQKTTVDPILEKK